MRAFPAFEIGAGRGDSRRARNNENYIKFVCALLDMRNYPRLKSKRDHRAVGAALNPNIPESSTVQGFGSRQFRSWNPQIETIVAPIGFVQVA